MVVGLALILGRPAPDVFMMLTERRGWSITDAETWPVEVSKRRHRQLFVVVAAARRVNERLTRRSG